MLAIVQDLRKETVRALRTVGDLPRYPGRGLVAGRDDEGSYWLYFVTGRSDASRARRFERRPGALAVVPTLPDTAADDLRHYDCVLTLSSCTVVGNGSHVTTLARALDAGDEFGAAFSATEPEPDPPIFTPRIVGAFVGDEVWLAAVRRENRESVRAVRTITLQPGEAWMLHTYASDADAVEPSGVPYPLDVSTRLSLLDELWASLDPARRVLAATGRAGSAVPTAEISESHS